MVVAYAAFFSVGILVPLWLQRNLGYTAIWAGFATAPIGLLPVLLTPFVGRYSHKFDLRILASVAFIAMSMTSFARSGFNLDVDFPHIALVQLLQGFGVALFFMPVLQILLSDLQPWEIAAGSAVRRSIGQPLVTAVIPALEGNSPMRPARTGARKRRCPGR